MRKSQPAPIATAIRNGSTSSPSRPAKLAAIGAMTNTVAALLRNGVTAIAAANISANALTLKEAYDSIEWPILILLGAPIPVSEALRTTGATDLVAPWLSDAALSLASHRSGSSEPS